MAAISTALALIGLGLAGGFAAKSVADRKKNPDEAGGVAGPHATLGGGELVQPAPPPTLNGGLATSAATAAANRQRKRAAAGSTLATSASVQPKPAGKSQPLTLLGY